MSKKNLLIRGIIFVILLAMVIPSFAVRVKNESDNKDVIFALNLNDAQLLLSADEVEESIEENKSFGVNTVVVEEESLNSLITRGHITAIKYGVLCHKYDDESEVIIKALADNRKIHNDSYVLISKREEWKEHLDKWVNAKYAKEDFVKLEADANADVYVLYDGLVSSWHTDIGFDEKKLALAKEKGMNIVLSLRLGAYSDAAYVGEIERIIKEYGITHINIKKSEIAQEASTHAEKNYKAFCELIKKNGLFLIVTETETQLSNKKPIGYAELIKSAGGRVLRGYETIDVDTKNLGPTIYDTRSHRIVNSVIDRNIRFVSIKQLTNGTDPFDEKGKKTNIATKAAIEKIREIGYNTESYDKVYKNYTPYRTLTSMAALVMMILMGVTVIEWLFNKRYMWLEKLATAGAVMGVLFTYFAPESIVLLYPTLFAVVSPCFAMTLVAVYVREMRDKLKPWQFGIASLLVTLVTLFLCATVQIALLSGLDYYLNSIIFRGIKISLIVPIAYSMILYGMIFGDTEESLYSKAKRVLNADVKVYWTFIALVLGGVAAIYLIRSGNVEKISPVESFMRNTISAIMPARPRTKEFLVGWPCLMLFFYYVKNTNCTLLRWGFSVGSSILFASFINSFCHVFTSAEVIYTRAINGLIVGMLVSLVVLLANCIIVKLVKKYCKEGQ